MFDYSSSRSVSFYAILLTILLIACMGIVIIVAIGSAEYPEFRGAINALENVERSGVSNPVTAVLLNFRSYDTLLELAVLLSVVVILMPSIESVNCTESFETANNPDAALNLVRKILPLTLIMSGYLLWTGANDPGGAFQAGALLAGCGLMALLTGIINVRFRHKAWRYIIVFSLIVFIVAGATSASLNNVFLSYQEAQAGLFILAIEFAATFSIAIALVIFYWAITTDAEDQPQGGSK